jgi:hypothetical protein
MITLTSDKFALVKAGFSIRDPIHQGPGWPTPRQIAHPRGFSMLKRDDTSTGTATRVAHCGSLLEGLELSYAQAR